MLEVEQKSSLLLNLAFKIKCPTQILTHAVQPSETIESFMLDL